jgi:ketosteroid isomerase-like protein
MAGLSKGGAAGFRILVAMNDCWVCRFERGQLRELTEYMDTELTNRVLKRATSWRC